MMSNERVFLPPIQSLYAPAPRLPQWYSHPHQHLSQHPHQARQFEHAQVQLLAPPALPHPPASENARIHKHRARAGSRSSAGDGGVAPASDTSGSGTESLDSSAPAGPSSSPAAKQPRYRRKYPSCDTCRVRKVKCNATELSSCTECKSRGNRCQFTAESNRRMLPIKQMKTLEVSVASARDCLAEMKTLLDAHAVALPAALAKKLDDLSTPKLCEPAEEPGPAAGLAPESALSPPFATSPEPASDYSAFAQFWATYKQPPRRLALARIACEWPSHAQTVLTALKQHQQRSPADAGNHWTCVREHVVAHYSAPQPQAATKPLPVDALVFAILSMSDQFDTATALRYLAMAAGSLDVTHNSATAAMAMMTVALACEYQGYGLDAPVWILMALRILETAPSTTQPDNGFDWDLLRFSLAVTDRYIALALATLPVTSESWLSFAPEKKADALKIAIGQRAKFTTSVLRAWHSAHIYPSSTLEALEVRYESSWSVLPVDWLAASTDVPLAPKAFVSAILLQIPRNMLLRCNLSPKASAPLRLSAVDGVHIASKRIVAVLRRLLLFHKNDRAAWRAAIRLASPGLFIRIFAENALYLLARDEFQQASLLIEALEALKERATTTHEAYYVYGFVNHLLKSFQKDSSFVPFGDEDTIAIMTASLQESDRSWTNANGNRPSPSCSANEASFEWSELTRALAALAEKRESHLSHPAALSPGGPATGNTPLTFSSPPVGAQ